MQLIGCHIKVAISCKRSRVSGHKRRGSCTTVSHFISGVGSRYVRSWSNRYNLPRPIQSIRGATSVAFYLHFGSYLLVFERPVYENISYRAYGCQEDNNTDDNALWKNRTSETERPLAAFLELDAIKQVYLYGHKNPELISPDNWNMDFRFMERPGARQVQMDLFYDYRNNVALYPQWQKFLHERHPDTLIFWGQNDIFFTPEGGEAYLRDLPNAEIHRLNSGHFALEDCLEEISNSIVHFYESRVAKVLVRE